MGGGAAETLTSSAGEGVVGISPIAVRTMPFIVEGI